MKEKKGGFPIEENNNEERRGYVTLVVGSYLRESEIDKPVSSEALSALRDKMVDLLVPVEMRFRYRWHDKKGEDLFSKYKDKVTDEYYRYPQGQTSPEAQGLKQIADEIRDQFEVKSRFGMYVPEALVLRTFNKCLDMMEANVATYSQYRKFKSGVKRQRESNSSVIDMRSSVRRTRKGGVDANPPSSKSEWRRE